MHVCLYAYMQCSRGLFSNRCLRHVHLRGIGARLTFRYHLAVLTHCRRPLQSAATHAAPSSSNWSESL